MAGYFEQRDDLQQAIQEYQLALRADHKNTFIRLNLASTYIKDNQVSQAEEELKRIIKIEPQAVEAHAILALLYSSQEKIDLAASEYELALKGASQLQPKNINLYKALGELYLQRRNFKSAEETYRLIVDLAPEDPQAHFYLANIYEELKKREWAEKELRKALELKPDYPEALNYLGYLYVEEDKFLDKAEIMIKKALEIDPDNAAYIDSIGWLYFKQGKLDAALKELERASSLFADPAIYDHLGDAYNKLGNIDQAKASWQKSLELNPEQEKVKEKLK